MINDKNINWLIEYVFKLNEQFKSVSAKSKDDYSEDRLKIFFHRERFSNFLMGNDLKVVPITFEIWPSLSCDARCPLCTYSLNNARKEADNSKELFLSDTSNYKSIISKFKEANVNSIIITGGGEPFINQRLSELVRHIYDLHLSWGMFTHGMLINENNIHELLSSDPRFIRISVNAGSTIGHQREYRIGMHTYDLVKKNAILSAAISNSYNKCISLGYALNGKLNESEFSGIKDFVVDVMEKSKGGLASVSFRPKVIYYNSKGQPSTKQPSAELLPSLVEKIEERIVYPLRTIFKDDLKVDFKKGMFIRLNDSGIPSNSIATAWTGSIDERGRAYILSELNGSKWKNSEIGNFSTGTFQDVWLGGQRKELVQKYSKGEILAPIHHKLSHIDETLKEIRNKIGILKELEVTTFFERLNALSLVRPKNWDFL